MRSVNSREELLTHEYFKAVNAILNDVSNNVEQLAFYDFMESRADTSLQHYYRSQMVVFQSFKHQLFDKNLNFILDRELNVTYDCFAIDTAPLSVINKS